MGPARRGAAAALKLADTMVEQLAALESALSRLVGRIEVADSVVNGRTSVPRKPSKLLGLRESAAWQSPGVVGEHRPSRWSAAVSHPDRVNQIDESLVDHIKTGGTSEADRRSLLALHAALAARGDFSYLKVGSYHGASMQSFIADPRCRTIVSMDRRDESSPDERSEPAHYAENTTARMLEHLSEVPGANLAKLTAIEATTADVDPAELNADFCFIDAEHTDTAVLQDAHFCLQAVRGRGVIVFHDRTLVPHGIHRFLRGLSRCRVYPLAHELLVVEIGIPSLFPDPRVKAQLPHKAWIVVDRLGATRLALGSGRSPGAYDRCTGGLS